MLYESFKYCPRGPPQATHASAWRKWEKWVPKLIRMIGFRQNFEIFPEAPGWPGWVFYDVFWCSGPLGTFLEWSWMNSGNFNFSWFSSKFWPQNVDQCFQSNFAPSEAMRVLVYPKDPSRCALSNGNLRFENDCQNSINVRTIHALAARKRVGHPGLNFWKIWLAPPWPRITLIEHRKYALRVI